MAYKICCEVVGCSSELHVRAIGSLPPGWVEYRYAERLAPIDEEAAIAGVSPAMARRLGVTAVRGPSYTPRTRIACDQHPLPNFGGGAEGTAAFSADEENEGLPVGKRQQPVSEWPDLVGVAPSTIR